MLHRRTSPSTLPGSPLSFHPLFQLSRFFENGLGNVLAGFGQASPFADAQADAVMVEIRPPIPHSLLKAEVESLPAEQLLVTSGQFSVHFARAEQFPWCCAEKHDFQSQNGRDWNFYARRSH